jgi:LytS/YehU family sensor histidine kinase
VLLLALGVHYSVRTGLNFYLVSEDIWPEAIGVQKPFRFNHILAVSIGELYVLSLTAAIKFTIEFLNERTKNQQLRELQYQTELKYLKAQMQPHFFFNTLNNLYALTLKRSSEASDVVVRLSDFMKYVIYDAKKKEVPLLKEIEYIDNYIALEKLRHGLNFEANISITGDMDDVLVPPLLFLPLVENAFKHGGNNQERHKIAVDFKKLEKQLIFTIQNYYDPELKQQQPGGIGLVNLTRRLHMLYKDRYTLKNQTDKNEYVVTLIIPIA